MAPEKHAPRLASAGWALRRAAMGLVMLLVMVMLAAWLLYTSIDADEASAGQASPLMSEDQGDSRAPSP
jgi:hypothetical protein